MRERLVAGEKPLHWVSSSKRDLLTLPEAVIEKIGWALSVAQIGGKHRSAKRWKGLGPGILEVVEIFEGNAYRAVYTVRFALAVYVLHCFQKKSPRGIETARLDIALVRQRLRTAQADYEVRYGKEQKQGKSSATGIGQRVYRSRIPRCRRKDSQSRLGRRV